MIARILGGVCVGLAALAAVQTFNLARSDHELKAARTLLATEKASTARLQSTIMQIKATRQTEREQCAADFAGEVMRANAERAKAVAATRARASITGICPTIAKTKAERNAALRANSGE
jgi:hypothetical protein